MIEQEIQHLTKAVNRLCDILEKQGQAGQQQTPPPPAAAQPPPPPPAKTPASEGGKQEGGKSGGGKKEAAPTPAAEAPAEAATPGGDKKGGGTDAGKGGRAELPSDEGVTLTELRAMGRSVIDAGQAKAMRELITKLGAESLTTLDVGKYAEAMKGLENLLGKKNA